MSERIIGPDVQSGDAALDLSLRPRRLDDDEFVNQTRVKEQLRIAIEAARHRGEPLDHVLLHGAAGLGKTTLANIIATELGVRIRTTRRTGYRAARRSGRYRDEHAPRRRVLH